ncbi:hypothetical protein PN482_07220 [Microcystis aeruginosa CS-555/01A07]|uniref:hypothetical protein n=1 Tax=Microcystis aeruginosa TaxID=1126 RepID=UPI00232B581F|nr:hypothetical protein [Microcystis aeruginosa]MDB9428706.1 hypothetical protein [Microcystis aeruginosa CS-555/01A07]
MVKVSNHLVKSPLLSLKSILTLDRGAVHFKKLSDKHLQILLVDWQIVELIDLLGQYLVKKPYPAT